MCVVSHGLCDAYTSPVIVPHSRVHTSHGCLDLHGHSARHRPHTAGIWGIHAPGAPWEGLGWVGYMVIPALGFSLHRGAWRSPSRLVWWLHPGSHPPQLRSPSYALSTLESSESDN
nr:MAG TPA: hypothetical protein [Caudoviricetes sp.]